MKTVSPLTRQFLPYALLKGKHDRAFHNTVFLALQSANSPIEQFSTLANATSSNRDEKPWQDAQIIADQQIEKANELDVRILSPFDDAYPKLLATTQNFPLVIWVKGNLSSIPTQSVAVIGPREPTRHGTIIASRVAQYFAEAGWSVVSGLAIGCDTAAHQATLKAGGHTVAVLAHGLQMTSPKPNKPLAERIVKEGGALISEFPLGAIPSGKTFVQRDRTQAGLSQGVVMVQSDLTGGSLHAPRAALSYRRWVAVPYPTEADRAEGAKKIQANLILAGEQTEEKARLMRCAPDALDQIIVLQSKDDYKRLTVIEDSSITQENTRQHALL